MKLRLTRVLLQDFSLSLSLSLSQLFINYYCCVCVTWELGLSIWDFIFAIGTKSSRKIVSPSLMTWDVFGRRKSLRKMSQRGRRPIRDSSIFLSFSPLPLTNWSSLLPFSLFLFLSLSLSFLKKNRLEKITWHFLKKKKLRWHLTRPHSKTMDPKKVSTISRRRFSNGLIRKGWSNC